jgi:methylmalonyl-CoA/ethylmalonyl-CoA epimerase
MSFVFERGLGMIKGINHLGIVVRSVDDVVGFLKGAFGAELLDRIEFPELQQISAVVKIGDGCFEIMEPTGPDGAVGKFLETKGGGLHHISLLCDDVDEECDRFEEKGLKVVARMFEKPRRVGFIHPKSAKGILFELAERSSLETSK